jgi:hypothetical protein
MHVSNENLRIVYENITKVFLYLGFVMNASIDALNVQLSILLGVSSFRISVFTVVPLIAAIIILQTAVH